MRDKHFFKYLFYVVVVLISFKTFAQVGIGTTSPNLSSILELSSTDKGFLPPRITLTGSTDVVTVSSPAEGLMVYNTGSACSLPAGIYVYAQGNWNILSYGNSFSNSRLIKDRIGVSNITFTPINGVNTYAGYTSLFDGVDNTGGSTFHLTRSGTPAGDWGFGMQLGDSYFISELILDGRNDCCTTRVGNIVAKLYLCGTEVYASTPIVSGISGDNKIVIPSVYADEIRLVIPLGGNTGAGDNEMNFSELDVVGYK